MDLGSLLGSAIGGVFSRSESNVVSSSQSGANVEVNPTTTVVNAIDLSPVERLVATVTGANLELARTAIAAYAPPATGDNAVTPGAAVDEGPLFTWIRDNQPFLQLAIGAGALAWSLRKG